LLKPTVSILRAASGKTAKEVALVTGGTSGIGKAQVYR